MSGAARAEAATYHRRGWCPIPVKDRSKEPNIAELAPYLSRPATKEELGSWSWPGVGIVTGRLSGVLVLDVDGPEGEAELKKHGHPVTPMVRTGGGGLHLYFRCPDEGVRTGIRVAPGLDVKAAGGYVVAPPSVGPTGEAYEWIVGPDEAEPADPPEWLMRIIERPRRAKSAGAVGDRIPSGKRNQELTSIAGSMRRRGLGEEEILAALMVTNEGRCEPPLEDEEVRKIAASVGRYEPANDMRIASSNGNGGVPPLRRYTHSDLGNAERFRDMFGDRVRWCPARKSWLLYDGKRWAWDDRGHVVKLAQEAARSIYREAELEPEATRQKEIAKFAVSSQNEGRINGMLSQAKPHVAVRLEELDADPWVINCQNGTLDLRTGKLEHNNPTDLITKIVPVDYEPGADCPRFKRFLKEVLVEDAVISFVKRYTGYSATGITRERLFAILHGFGKNGKTTLVELFQDVLGDYAINTDTETILAKKYQGVGNDVAALKGARFVSAAEVEKGRRLAESKVKQLTGSDTVTARYLFGEPFDFRPQFKLWLSTNNKPVVQGADDAIWDRIRLIPFTQRFEGSGADAKLSKKLREEMPGIFAWMVEGCLEWQEHGLGEPESVASATKQYREEMDTLAAFLEDRCVVSEDLVAPATPLYKQYRFWCDDSGEKPETQKMFGMRLRERGFLNEKITSGPHKDRKGWFGIGLRADHPDPEDPDNGGADGPPESGDSPLGGLSADDGPLDQNNAFAGKRSGETPEADHSGPKNQTLQAENTREERDVEKRSASSAPSAHYSEDFG